MSQRLLPLVALLVLVACGSAERTPLLSFPTGVVPTRAPVGGAGAPGRAGVDARTIVPSLADVGAGWAAKTDPAEPRHAGFATSWFEWTGAGPEAPSGLRGMRMTAELREDEAAALQSLPAVRIYYVERLQGTGVRFRNVAGPPIGIQPEAWIADGSPTLHVVEVWTTVRYAHLSVALVGRPGQATPATALPYLEMMQGRMP